jgi:alanine racemase
MGFFGYTTRIFNLARPGLMLYGLYPTDELKKKIQLKPAMSVTTHVLYVKAISKGRGVSYGHTFVAKKNIKAATLAIGYSDGYFRSLSNKSVVLIHGKQCPVIGNVTMDQIVVDVSSVKSVKAGDIAVVLGRDQKQAISAEELAKQAGTINYEIVCNLGNRLARSYKN